MITPGEEHRLAGLRPGEDYESFRLTGGVYHFVKKHVHESFLASLLTSWLAKRKAIKKLLAACEDPRQRTILDKQQLAIKCTCNAVYGFTGVANGLFPCLSIADPRGGGRDCQDRSHPLQAGAGRWAADPRVLLPPGGRPKGKLYPAHALGL